MIKLQIIGHLGADCSQNDVNGKHVINFNVAHSEKYKDSQGNLVEKTTWVKCAYWTDRTGIAPYLLKGQLVYAEGTPEAEGYLNKDNQNAASLKMRVHNIQLLGSRSDGAGDGGNREASSFSNAQPSNVSTAGGGEDDLPF